MTDLCANCGSPALFIYAGQGTRSVSYCNGCLPSFLRPLANKGLLAKTSSFDALQVQTQEALQPAVEEETAVDEELVVDDSAPVSKKRRKAAAVVEPVTAEETEEVVPDVVVEELLEDVVEELVEVE